MSSSFKESIQLSKYGIAVIILLFLGTALRICNLDFMAFHHDESIHAYYSYTMYKGDFSRPYDPTYHGQFLYHYGALFFLLFGDSDVVARLPYVSFGLLLFYFVIRLKPSIGSTAVLATLLLAVFSPTLTYFSRFARNDVYMGTMALGIVVFALDYLRTLQGRYLVGLSFFLALMYTCKENSYMTGFIFGSFAVLYGIYYYFSYTPEIRQRGLADIFKDRAPFVKLLTLYGLFSCTAFSLVYYVAHSQEFLTTSTLYKQQRNLDSYEISVLRDAWNNYMQTHPGFAQWGIFTWVLTPVILAFVLFLLYGFIAKKTSSTPPEGSWFSRLAKNNISLVVSLLVIFAVYTAMFTNLGHVPQGMKSGVIDYLLYWMGQHGNPRIPGPPDYYALRLLIYEPTLVIFGIVAFLVYTWNAFGPVNFWAFQLVFWVTVYGYWSVILTKSSQPMSALLLWLISICIATAIVLGRKFASLFSFIPKELIEPEEQKEEKTENLFKPNGVRAFLLYWSIFSLLIYALLEEKVPWLLVHQALPLSLLAGVFISDVWKTLGPGALRSVFVAMVALLVVYEARTDFQLNMYRPDDPRELIIYTQTDHSLTDVVKEIKAGAIQLGSEYTPPNPTKPIAAFQGTSVWPYVWYFRNYLTTSHSSGLPTPGVPFAVVDYNLEENMKAWGKGKYTKRKLTHRGWWPPALPTSQRQTTPSFRHEMPFQYARKRNKSTAEAWEMLWKYILYRQVWDTHDPSIQPGGEYVLFYSRTPLVEPEESPQVAKGYDQPTRPLSVVKMVGKFGQGEAEFFEPRGVALSPDESRLYVLDAMNGRIQVFDSDLNFQGWFGGPGRELGHLRIDEGNGPNGGIGVAPDGTIYVTDTWAEGGGRINHYQPDGSPLPPLVPTGDNFFFPRGLAIAKDGSIYVADTGNNRIVKFNRDGSYAGPVVTNQLKEPVGVAIGPNGWIYVCDVGMKRVAAFTAQNHLIRQWQILGWKVQNEQFIPWIEPYVSVDQAGNLYVSDSTTHTIHRFDPLGQKVVQAGGEGNAPGMLRKPKGVVVDSKGFLYIADSENHRIVKAKIQ